MSEFILALIPPAADHCIPWKRSLGSCLCQAGLLSYCGLALGGTRAHGNESKDTDESAAFHSSCNWCTVSSKTVCSVTSLNKLWSLALHFLWKYVCCIILSEILSAYSFLQSSLKSPQDLELWILTSSEEMEQLISFPVPKVQWTLHRQAEIISAMLQLQRLILQSVLNISRKPDQFYLDSTYSAGAHVYKWASSMNL